MSDKIKDSIGNINRILNENAALINNSYENPASAKNQYEKIVAQISKFQDSLDDSQEVSVCLCNFGQSIVMTVVKIGFQNPSLMYFWGYVNGYKSQLVQHVNQISFLLTAVPKTDPEAPPRRIGFGYPKQD